MARIPAIPATYVLISFPMNSLILSLKLSGVSGICRVRLWAMIAGGGGGGGTETPPPEMMSWGTFYCNIFSRLLWVWPSTPDGMKLADLARSLAGSIPFIGDKLVYLVFKDLAVVLSLVVMIKLIKLLPAKF